MGLQTKALGFVAVLGIYSCSNNKAESVVEPMVNYDSLVVPVIKKGFEELNADSISMNSDLDTIVNSNEYLILGKKSDEILIVSSKEASFNNYNKFIQYKNDVILIRNKSSANLRCFRKFRPKKGFENFQVEVFNGQLKDPDFSTYPNSKYFKTRILSECKKGINYAGYFTLVTWGCGSPCQTGVIVNRKTGQIFGGVESVFGMRFKPNSRMIINNVGLLNDTNGLIELNHFAELNCAVWCGTEFDTLDL